MKRFTIVTNGKWRRWIFESDPHRAKRFANRFGFDCKEVSEVPFHPGYTVWVEKESEVEISDPVVYTQRPYDELVLGI